MSAPTIRSRQYYLDWLRVLSMLLVFVFHASRIFGEGRFHVNNARGYEGIDTFTAILTIWGIPLLFLVAGASVYLSLGKTAPRPYLRERVSRLLVPFVVGSLTHVPIQVYLERVNHGEFAGSFFDFLPHYFDGLYGFGGNFAWMGLHLWFLMMLFLYTLIALPVLVWLARGRGAAVLERFAGWLARPGVLYLGVLPVGLLAVLLPPDGLGIRELGGWNIFVYMVYFLFGAVLVAHDGVRQRIERDRWISLAAAVVFLVIGSIIWANGDQPAYGTWRYPLFYAVQSLCSWCGLLAIWGFSIRHLNFGTVGLYLANEAVLPFYVLHQTVLVIVGFAVVQWGVADWLKYAVIFFGSLAIIIGLYWFFIRPYNALRFLFGMRPKKAREAAIAPPAGAVGH
jgi:hypothetical protein